MAKDVNGNEIPTFESSGNSIQKTADGLNRFLTTVNQPTKIATSDGQLLETNDPNDVSLAALSTDHSVDPSQVFTVKKYDGTVGEVSGADLQKVLASGDYLLESNEERALREDETKYGEKNLEAAALGAARGLTFGVSDAFLSGGFYKGDDLRGIENANKVASIGGEIGGAILPAILSGGSSAAAQTAGKTLGAGIRLSENLGAKVAAKVALQAEGLAAKEASLGAKVLTETAEAAASGASTVSATTAEAATNLFQKSLVKSGYAAKEAKNIASKMLYGGFEHMAPDAANLAVQGALQGAGRLVTEDAFGTAELNAESLLAYGGLGALVGGTFGAAIGAGKALVPKAAELISPITGKIGETFDNAVGSVISKEKAAMNLVDLSPSALAKARTKRPDFDTLITNEVDDVLTTAKPKNKAEFDEAIIKKHEDIGNKIGNLYKQADDIIARDMAQGATKIDAPIINGQTVSSNIMKAVDDHLSELGMAVTGAEKRSLFNVGDEFVTEFSKQFADKPVTAQALQDIAKSLQKKIYPKGAMLANEAEASQKLVRKAILDAVRAEQRNLVKQASDVVAAQGGQASLVDELLKLNKSYSVLNDVVHNSQKSLAKNALKSGMDVDTKDAAALLIDPAGAVGFKAARLALSSFAVQKRIAMGSLEKSGRTMAQAMKTGLNAMSKGTKMAAKAAEPSVVRSLVSSQLAVRNEDGKKMKPRNEAEAYANIIENANKAVTDPESALLHSNRQTASLYEHAPNTAAAIDAKYLQVMQFIASKAKKSNKNTGLFDTKTIRPSGFETAKMARYLDAITNPQSMVEKAAKGKLSREHVEVMANIFPEMHKQMKDSTLDFLAKEKQKGTKFTYQQQLQIGQLIGIQAHESTSPENVQALQSMFADQEAAQQQDYSPARADSLDISGKTGGGVYDAVDGE